MSEVRRTLPPPVRPRRDSASIAPPTHRATSDGNDACDALLLLTAPQEPAELPPPSLVRARPPPPPTRPPPLRPYLPVAASDGPVDQLNASNTTTADASAEEGSAVVQPTPSPRNARKMSTQTPRPEKPTRPAPELDHGSPCRAAPSPARRPSRPDLLPFQPESRLPSRCDTITAPGATTQSSRPTRRSTAFAFLTGPRLPGKAHPRSVPASPAATMMGDPFGDGTGAPTHRAPRALRRMSFHGMTASNHGAELMSHPGANFYVKSTSKFKGKKKRFIAIDAVNRLVNVSDAPSSSEDGKLADPTASVSRRIGIPVIIAADLDNSTSSITLTYTDSGLKMSESKITMEAVDPADALLWYNTLRVELLSLGTGGAFRWRKQSTLDVEAILEQPKEDSSTPKVVKPIPTARSESSVVDSKAKLLTRAAELIRKSKRYCPLTVVDLQRELAHEFGETFVDRMVNEIRDVMIHTAAPPAAVEFTATSDALAGSGGVRTGPLRVLIATMNVGNSALKVDQLQHWLKGGQDAEVIAVGLQESVSYHGYVKAGEGESKGGQDTEAVAGELQESVLDHGYGKAGEGESDSSEGEGEDDEDGEAKASSRFKTKDGKESKASVKTAIREKLMLDGDHVLKTLLEHLNGGETEAPRVAGSPTGYKLAVSLMRGEMRLLVFTRITPRFPIHSVETTAVNTGLKILGQRQPNKGGIVIKIVLGMTTLCFVTCHLAAHEGKQYFEARNTSITEIIRGANIGNRDCDLTQQFHHTFFFGDLNYRVDLSAEPIGGLVDPTVRDIDPPTLETGGKKKMTKKQQKEALMVHKRAVHAMHFSAAFKIISDRDAGLRRLYSYDELQRALNQGGALSGFNMARPLFAPTFKVTKGDSKITDEKGLMIYNLKRVPSWCDRILWKSLPGHQHRLSLISHESAERVTSSDHKPVAALFSLTPAPLVARKKEKTTLDLTMVVLSDICATLPTPRKDGLSESDFVLSTAVNPDGIVARWSNTPELAASVRNGESAADDGAPDTETNLTWVQSITLGFNSSDLREVHLILNLRDCSREKNDQLFGSAVIPLGALYTTQFGDEAADPVATLTEVQITVPLVRGGLQVGDMSATILLNPEWDPESGLSHFESSDVFSVGGAGAESIC